MRSWRIPTAALLAVGMMIGPVTAQELPGQGRTVSPIKGPPANSWFFHLVVQIGLERLGYTVEEHAQAEFPALHLAVANGDVDYSANHWTPLHDAFFEQAGGDERMSRVGTLVEDAEQGYLIDKATAEANGITSIEQLKDPELAKLFDSDGDGLANLAGCDPGWGCERVIEHHLDAYGLRDTVEHDQGVYFAIIANAIERYRESKPILYYTWTPLWVGNVLVPGEDSTWLTVPFPTVPEGTGSVESVSETGFQVNDITVIANNEFLAENPAAKRLFELVTIPLADVNAENKLLYEGEDSPEELRRHAEDWVEANQALFDGWIEEALQAGAQ